MTTEQPNDPLDLPDTDLRELFAGVHPAAGFEDRLVTAVRQRRRLRLPIPPHIPQVVQRAAIAAAAVLAVGTVGYFGNRAIMENHAERYASLQNSVNTEPNELINGLTGGLELNAPAEVAKSGGDDGEPKREARQWDFGGGSNSAQNWRNWNDTGRSSKSSPYDNLDSILLPYAGSYGADDEKTSLSGKVPASDVPAHFQHSITHGGEDFGLKTEKNGAPDLSLQNTTSSPRYDGAGGVLGRSDGRTNGGKFRDAIPPADQSRALDYFNVNAADKATLDSLDHFSVSAVTSPGQGKETEGHQQDGQKTMTIAGGVIANGSGTDTIKVTDLDNSTVALTAQESAPKDQKANGDQPALFPPTVKTLVVGSNPAANTGANQLQAVATAPVTPATTAPVVDDRKIIRTGTMEFDVDRFDTAQMQITKIVLEFGGFVGATDSQKLPNGKVRGSISVRVPPERLDTLVLSLRALGDLKSQQITAADITKEYTDLQSELTADRSMQDRLLQLIHDGKGTVKDLLAAENELGEWRTKIEKAEGMIRYYNGQVALSTLEITLSERDIQTPATAIETETADVGIEADDVEKARNSALKTIDDVKGRIVEAELKRFDAGQLAARLVADVPPESAGAVIDQLKQLGKVARLEVHRQQTSSDGTPTGSIGVTNTTPLRTDVKPTRLLISIYNLANVAPRRTTNVSLAAVDVEAAYAALVTVTKSNGGRVVTSALDRGDPAKASGLLVLEFPPDKFDAAMTTLHAQGDVLRLNLTENPDTQNSTEAKQGLTVRLISLAAVQPRETVQQTLAATDVPTAYQAILSAANAAHARMESASLNEQDRQNISANIQLEVPRSFEAQLDKALADAGGTISRTSTRPEDSENTVDSKVELKLAITSTDHLAPRETMRLQVEVADVDKSAEAAQAAAIAAGGRVLDASIVKENGKDRARVILDFPLAKSGDVLQSVRGEGTVRGIDASRDQTAPTGPLAHAQIFVEFRTGEAIVSVQTGPWASVRQGLSTSINGLLWSLQWVVVGLCLIGPWAGIGWIGWKLRGKIRRTKLEASKQ